MLHCSTYTTAHNIESWELVTVELNPQHRTLQIRGTIDGWKMAEFVLYSNNDATWAKFQRAAEAFNAEPEHSPLIEAMKPTEFPDEQPF